MITVRACKRGLSGVFPGEAFAICKKIIVVMLHIIRYTSKRLMLSTVKDAETGEWKKVEVLQKGMLMLYWFVMSFMQKVIEKLVLKRKSLIDN